MQAAVDEEDTVHLFELIDESLKRNDDERLYELLNPLESAELAHVLEAFPHNVRARLWSAAGHEAGADVLLHMNQDAAAQLGEELGAEALLETTTTLDATEVAELVEALSDEVTEELLAAMDAARRQQVDAVLSSPEGTAGRIVHHDAVAVRPEVSVSVLQRYLNRFGELPENTDQLMVVTREQRFLGTVRVLDLLRQPADSQVSEIMTTEIRTVAPEMEQRELLRLFLDHDLVSAPVVGDDGKLLGRVMVSDVMDILQEEAERAIMAPAGLDEDEDLFAPLLSSARNRAIWLGINLGTAFLAAWVIGLFESTLDQIVALAVLMPIVASMGGIAGSQTLALAIRGLALGQIAPSNTRWLLRKEVGIGVLNGLLWALVVAAVASLWFRDLRLGAVIAAALVINMLAAAVAGLLVPLALDRMRFDPALSGSVILTTVTDVIGFMSFLGLATLFLL